MTEDAQRKINRGVYHASDVDKSYGSKALTRVEAVTLRKYRPLLADGDILDIDVGTGEDDNLPRRYVRP